MTVFSSRSQQVVDMTMQKAGQNGQQTRQQHYVTPESPAPSTVKKSPLAMLVDACSNIGQELNKTSKPADLASQLEARKTRNSTSPLSNNGSKPNSPPLHSQPPRLNTTGLSARPKFEPQVQANKEQLSAASIASQYQFMYQQLLYQAELEYLHKNKGANVGPIGGLTKVSPELAKACGLCRMNPGYNGHCVHDNNTLNQVLTMINPGSAAAMLAYRGKLSTFQHPYDAALASTYPGATRSADSSISPNDSVETQRISTSSHVSPKHSSPAEQPMDLHVEKSKTPPASSTKLIECHWVGAEGYCGKRFPSQEDVMEHLKQHVAACPNVVVTEESKPVVHKAVRSSPVDRHSYTQMPVATHNSLLTIGSKRASTRFQPYPVTDRALPSALLLGTPR